MIRILLPQPLRTLAAIHGEISLDLHPPATLRSLLDALETQHPALRGTLRDLATGQRRPMVRFFACEEDLSHQSIDAPLPDSVARGAQPLLIIGAIAGG